ncbi:BTB/POZ domain-containing protein 9-like [Neocloeon triangulifer]|uniref:BTB/POZ domain-containing protein 9-like n=1 Tax=Neocloeon triangulifer TaxID=2078957 RepID=UPI00286F88AB|nr:BTB/POZ domain-containing protein 9-like [Neocloeon triangulifer]XP_059482006.1 BTB/POZ domain-containing protein 9-like [Neocloeon triangulifer]XP_059482007.1 BTB/POZ domain-containing protein 9-like [Neocloeon triangulifer]
MADEEMTDASLPDDEHQMEIKSNTDVTDVQLLKWLEWLDSGKHSDCSFIVGRGWNQKRFDCHRLVLAAASPAFEKMLFGQFQEGQRAGPESSPIILRDCDTESFALILRYIYGRETVGMVEAQLDTVIQIFTFAAKWQLNQLDDLAADLCLQHKLDVRDLFQLHLLFVQHNYTDKADTVFQRMRDQASEALAHLEEASFETVEALLRSERLNIFSEMEVLRALVKWGAARVAASKNLKPATISTHVAPLLQYVQLGPLSKTDFDLEVEQMSCEEKEGVAAIKLLMETEKIDINLTPWRGFFNPDTLLFKVDHPFEYELLEGEKTFKFYFLIYQPVYLLGIELHSLCHLNPGLPMNLQISLKYDSEVIDEWRFKTECNRFSHACLKSSLVRLLNPCYLSNQKGHYCVIVKHQNDGPRMVPNTTRSSAAYGKLKITIEDCKVRFAPQKGDVCALEFGRPLQKDAE